MDCDASCKSTFLSFWLGQLKLNFHHCQSQFNRFGCKFGSGVIQEFLVLPGDADIDAFLDGSTDEPGQSCNKMQPVRFGMMVMLRA